MTYQNVFGGNTIYPSDVSYLALALDADTPLEWPMESSGNEDPAARIIDVTPSGAGYSIVLPDATLTGPGQTILFNNLSVSYSFFVKDYAGNTIATVGTGTQWQVYLSSNATAAGTWQVFRYGASTASVQPSALAGYGLTVTSNTISQSMPVTTFSVTPRTVLVTDRASILTWTGTGAAVLNLPSAATVGNNFFVSAKNSGGGDLTVTPAGGDTIDGAATFVLSPEDSATFVTNGLAWYTLGFGQDASFVFDYTSISLTGKSSPYTLSGTELNRIAYEFVGVLTATMQIVVPATVQQYWVNNQTTGSYTLSLKTASQVLPVTVPQGYSAILYCNGSNVILASASTATLPTTVGVAQGGTGISSYTTGDMLYASGASVLARLASVATGNAIISGGVGVIPSWGKIGLTTHVSGVLPIANGGTGGATSTGTGDLVFATGPTITLPNATGLPLSTGVTGTLPVANGGTGQTSYTNGQLLIGNTTGNTLTKSTLTAGANIAITNGTGSITIAFSPPSSGIVTSNGTALSSVTAPAGSLVGTTETQTLTNKRITPRVSSAASITSPLAWNSDNYDQYAATAQAGALTISADAGTPTDGQKAVLRFKDNGTSRTLTFTGGTSKGFRPVGVALATSGSNYTYPTTINKTVYFGCIFNSSADRWDIIALALEV